MEWLPGGTLADRLCGGPLAPREAVRMAAKLADAAHHAHGRRVIHQDIRPSNVVFNGLGDPVLVDFGIADAAFFPDLLDFLIWEDYGLTDGGIEGYFRGLDDHQADLCIEHLRHEVAALLEDDLEYQSEEALTLLSRVIAEQERFDEFEAVAHQMGSREWQRIIRLVDRAMKKRKKPVAIQVFEAALTKGSFLKFLTEKYEKLKQGHWSPDPRK
jgi:hypothetical protein